MGRTLNTFELPANHDLHVRFARVQVACEIGAYEKKHATGASSGSAASFYRRALSRHIC
jgi:hypothetical protein